MRSLSQDKRLSCKTTSKKEKIIGIYSFGVSTTRGHYYCQQYNTKVSKHTIGQLYDIVALDFLTDSVENIAGPPKPKYQHPIDIVSVDNNIDIESKMKILWTQKVVQL